MAAITDLTRGQMADSAILTPGLMTSEIVAGGFNAIGKGGTVVLTGAEQADGAERSSCPARSSRCSARRSRAACSATATRPPTSRRSSGSTRAATSSWTRSSPAPTRSTRSTRATTTCSTARTCAASSCTSTEQHRIDRGGRSSSSGCSDASSAAAARSRLLEAALDARRARRARRTARHRQVDAAARGRRRARTSPFVLVEGNAELTPARLVGHFDPARVLAEGYVAGDLRRRPAGRGAAQRRAALRRGAQPGPRGDAQRPDHGDVARASCTCPRLGRGRGPRRASGWSRR